MSFSEETWRLGAPTKKETNMKDLSPSEISAAALYDSATAFVAKVGFCIRPGEMLWLAVVS